MMIALLVLLSLSVLAATFIAGAIFGHRIATKAFQEIEELRDSLNSWSHK